MAPDPYAPSCGWWAYGKVGLRHFFGLCPAESCRQRLGHQALICVPQPQRTWSEAKSDTYAGQEDSERAGGPGNLITVNGTMKKEQYIKILNNNIRQSAEELGLGHQWTFQPDNDPKHTAKVVKKWSTDILSRQGLRPGEAQGLRVLAPPSGGGAHVVDLLPGKGRELTDIMEKRKVDIPCVQQTRWKGSKAHRIGAGFKLFYYGVDSKRNEVGVVLKEDFVRNFLEVKRVSDRVVSLKLEIEGVMLNVVSGYAPQVGCELKEKEGFWSELDEVIESIPTSERVVIGVDSNGHVGEGNTGDEEVMGKFGVKERNLE
ncbi:hypothetical protein QTP70_002967 [Hemibagrus guttatus]|uniref:Transposase n=1 Tax=Hemibagrus guttatus TaxID=175788 RepID=A0AAE0R576_9TELE|nr:hypothetical protein QTP70_002967 [Hemibagrus guttatus]